MHIELQPYRIRTTGLLIAHLQKIGGISLRSSLDILFIPQPGKYVSAPAISQRFAFESRINIHPLQLKFFTETSPQTTISPGNDLYPGLRSFFQGNVNGIRIINSLRRSHIPDIAYLTIIFSFA